MRTLLPLSTLLSVSLAQSGPWGQCGGLNWQGSTSCIAGWTCVYQNDWYSQCLQAPAGSTTLRTSTTSRSTTAPSSSSTRVSSSSSTRSSTTSSVPTTTSTPGKFRWFGVNEAGAEFGQNTYPGNWGKEFIFPDPSTISTLISQGFNIFRVAFAMERMAPSSLSGSFNAAYLQNLTTVVNHITNSGAYAVLDPHNFGRYFGNVITDTAAFGSFWTKLATEYKNNARVIFDTNNEYHDMDQTLVFNLNQVAINAIRATGATSQYIFYEGNSWSGAWTWNVTNGNLAGLTDPQNKLVAEMHQYLDTDGSGTSPNCVSSTIGLQRVVGATQWLRQNGKVGILGEFAGGANSVCETAVRGMLDHMRANSDVWLGALWWSAGPWWGDYIFGYEPPSGTGYNYYRSVLSSYVP